MDDNSEVKKSKGTKRCVIKRGTMFKNYTDCLFNDKIVLIVLQTFDGIETYPYGTNAFKVCESEMMVVRNLFVKKYVDCPFYGETVSKQ